MVEKKVMEGFCQATQQLQQRKALLVFGCFADFWKRDANLVGDFSYCFWKRQVFNLHQKPEGVAFLLAAETIEKLIGRIDREAWGLFVMKRAQAPVPLTIGFQGNVLPYEFDQVGLAKNFLEECLRERHAQPLLTKVAR